MPEITGGNDWLVFKFGNDWFASDLFSPTPTLHPPRRFQTWRDAYDYAERMARR